MASDNLEAEYFQYRRYSEAAGAGDRLLQQLGLDPSGRPLAKAEGQPKGMTEAMPVEMGKPLEAGISKPSVKQSVGFVTETGRAVVGGATDAIRNMIDTAGEIASWVESKTGIPKGGALAETIKGALPKIEENQSTVGGMARGVSQFLTGYLTGGKALGAAKAGTKLGPMIAGAFSDISAFDPNDPTLSNLVEQLNPKLKDSILTFLATDPSDSGAENRMKRAIEGAGLGVATDLLFRVVRHWRAAKNVKAVEQAFEQAKGGDVSTSAPEAPIQTQSAARPSAASQVDVVRGPSGDIPLGVTGRAGTMVGERRLLPPPTLQTADEIAGNMARESGAEGMLVGRVARQETAQLADQVRASPEIRESQEQLLREKQDQIVERLIAESGDVLAEGVSKPAPLPPKKRLTPGETAGMFQGIDKIKDAESLFLIGADQSLPRDIRRKAAEAVNDVRDALKALHNMDEETLGVISRGGLFANSFRTTAKAILQSQSGEVSSDALYAVARSTVGAAIGLTQGETMEDRISNALVVGGVAAGVKPAWVKKVITAMGEKFPKEVEVIKSFDQPKVGPGPASPFQRPKAVKPVEVASEAQSKAFLEANPDAIKVGKKAIKVNWSEIADQKQIDDMIKTLTDLNKESIDVARRGVQSDIKRQQLAEMLGITEDDMLKRRRGQALNAEQTQAYVDLYGSAVRELDRLATMVKAGEPVEAQFRAHLGKTTALTHEIFGARAEAGRSLRVWGQAAQEVSAGRELGAVTLAGKGTGDVPVGRLADMVLELKDSAQKATFLRQATNLGRSALLEAWINGLLTNPATHIANITSNVAVSINGVIERQISGMLGKSIARGEAGAMVHGLSSGWLDALRLARRAFVEGESQLGFSKLDMSHVPAITAENLGLSGPFGRAVDLLGQAVRSPGRALLAADDFFKAINYRMELHAQAYRQAFKEGGSDSRIASRMRELLDDEDFISIAKDAAEGFANYQTFNQGLGKFGSAYLNFLEDHPWARVVTPFVRTPVNIAKYTLERTPLLNFAMNQVRVDIAAGGVKRDMVLAKMSYGAMMFVGATSLAAAGFITGGGLRDPDLKAIKRSTGWQPDSFRVGDKWISFSRTDPIGAFFGMASRIVELSGEASEMDMEVLATAAVLAFKDTFINKSYAKGALDAFEAIMSPDRKWQNYFERLAGSLVPAGVAQITRTLDPTLREADGVMETITSRLPGLSKTLEPRLNIWGEPIMLEGGVGPDLVSPFYTSTEKKDLVSDEVLRLELSVGMPPKHIFGTRPTSGVFTTRSAGEGVELFPDEYSRFVKLAAGQGLEGTKTTLKEAIENLISSETYGRQSDLVKGQLIERIIGKYREAAERQLLREYDDLKGSVFDRMVERKEAKRPTGGIQVPEANP